MLSSDVEPDTIQYQENYFLAEQQFQKRERRRQRTRQLNDQLSLKPIFTPLSTYDIIHIHYATSIPLMYDLIYLAHYTEIFTMDTETNHKTQQPALIQIEFVFNRQLSRSIVLLIETVHLPTKSSILFRLIQLLLKVIFQPSNIILSWGNAMQELIYFVPYEIINFDTIFQLYFIDVQHTFKKWYNRTFIHECGLQYNTDHLSCTCRYRPYKRSQEKWSLQQAIACTFNEFLNKGQLNHNWIQGLDNHLHPDGDDDDHSQEHEQQRQHLIQYAVNDCLAVTKLFMAISNNWTFEQLQEYNTNTCISS